MASEPSVPRSEDAVESPQLSMGVEPGRLWKGEPLLPELLTQQHQEVMHTLAVHGCKLHEVLSSLSSRTAPATPSVPRWHLPRASESHSEFVLQSDSQLHIGTPSLPRPRTGTPAMKLPVPRKPQRPSFTPQLFKTFSQADLKLRHDAKRASRTYATETVSRREPWAERVVKHPAFDCFFTFIVISNALFVGVELQLSVENPQETLLAIQVLLYCYTCLFVLELCLRIAADGLKLFVGDDCGWAWLDLFIVLTSLWEVTVEVLSNLKGEDNEGGLAALTSLKAVRIIRITRIVKVSRLVRIFRFVLALRTLIASIIHTLKSLVWALLLLALIAYVFAILFMQAVNDYKQDLEAPALPECEYEASKRYFGTLGDAMLSLFMSITGGVSWEEVLGPLKAISFVWVVLYLFYIAFTYFAVLNVLTAVFCQSAIDGAQNDHASKVHAILANKEAHLEKIHTLFAKFGAQDGVITFTMFQEKINSPEVREYFQTLGLDVWDAWSFFKLLDKDCGGAVEVEEFLMGCLRLRGQASAMDVGKIINDQTWLIKNQGKFHAYIEVELKQIKDSLSALTGFNWGSDEHIGLIFGSRHGTSDGSVDGSTDSKGSDCGQ